MQYTDFLGQPITDGDEIVYAQSAYGGGAVLKRAKIVKIVPLVPHRDYPTRNANKRPNFMREDQARNRNPTDFYGDIYDDPAKRYVIQVYKERWTPAREVEQSGMRVAKYTIPLSQNIIKVPA